MHISMDMWGTTVAALWAQLEPFPQQSLNSQTPLLRAAQLLGLSK